MDEPEELDDTALIDRVRGGDREAYAALVRRHGPVAGRTAALLGAGADAEDVVQDSFVKAYQSLGRFRDGSPFRPWLLRIVANETRNLHRSRSRRAVREQSPATMPDPPADPVEQALAGSTRRELHQVLAGLPTGYRDVLVCRYLLDLDERETATVLGLAPGTVKSRTHRALRQLRNRWGATAEEAHRG